MIARVSGSRRAGGSRLLRLAAGVVAASVGWGAMPSAGLAAGAHRAVAVAGVGYDLAGPQCGSSYPRVKAFAVVGVNGGLANSPNPCLSDELSWARAASGLRSPFQPAVSLYVDTADPGPTHGVTDWPRATPPTGYGRCRGGWSAACAYAYGKARAEDSFTLARSVDPTVASGAPWWLDVETSASWATRRQRSYHALNQAAINGFIAGLRAGGVTQSIGIYSISTDWAQITGLNAHSAAAALGGSPPPAWIGGTSSRRHAQTECGSRGFTGTRPRLVQFRAGRYDGDLRCR